MSYQTKFTPGPWRWEVSQTSKHMGLFGGVPRYDLTVIDLDRWGMQGAQIRLREPEKDGYNIMHPVSYWCTPIAGREHHASWIQTIDHPDASLIAAAPDLLDALIDIFDYPEEDLHAWATGDQPITCSFTPDHIRRAKAAIEKAINIKK